MLGFRLFVGVSVVLTMFLATESNAQFDDSAYRKYLEDHQGMTTQDLLNEYPAGVFKESVNIDLDKAQFFDAIDAQLDFTAYEKYLTSKHGFMVTERHSYPTFQAAFFDAYINDLPVYISSDAILHALHRSYDNILLGLEQDLLTVRLEEGLTKLRDELSSVAPFQDPQAERARLDADVYLTVALDLIKYPAFVAPIWSENTERVNALLQGIASETMASVVVFGDTPRSMDFSQFTPRGHYTRSEELKKYFKTMMWLGRTEIYITKPHGAQPEPTDDDIMSQCMLSVLLNQLATRSGAGAQFEEIDQIITRFVGKQDNLSLGGLNGVVGSLGIENLEVLRDPSRLESFQQASIDAGASQQILSQLLWSDPFSDKPITPAAAFMLMGQRFTIDSYVLANVVFDKVDDRMMPSPLDVMFVLGNDAAIQLLTPELQEFSYAVNLAGQRYLMERMDESFWSESLYSTWLSGIRALNPPTDRSGLPSFMQTGAWWQKSLNSQLMSWTELRHDNLLYAKQSYTGGAGCFYPDGYVEPVPELYSAISLFASEMSSFLKQYEQDDLQSITAMRETLDNIDAACLTLSSMASKSLNGTPYSDEERDLIDNWIVMGEQDWICVKYDEYDGIYPNLMYGVDQRVASLQPDFVVADVHTQPTDKAGNIVGRILHVATGEINTAVVVPNDPTDGCQSAYVGPVGSYYEHITSDFDRLTDERWAESYKFDSHTRPSWVYNYIANGDGVTMGDGQSLVTSVDDDDFASSELDLTVYPNPVDGVATIELSLSNEASALIRISITDMAGRSVATFEQVASGSMFSYDWNTLDSNGEPVTAGVYVVTASTNGKSATHLVAVQR